ncbi:3'-5' exonuclease [Falsiroseomonas sp. HC035]|uniref:3'-5' exonuclease n=1 Tax=Falsiroseomonas sp. HC035 TaxID=3390999 RepID=UPI003D3210DC
MTNPLPCPLDIEASGLSDDSYPIEIGLALPSPTPGGDWEILLLSWLIRPTATWLDNQDAWSTTAEQVHGLTLDRLQSEGLDPAEVAREIDQVLNGRIVVADTGPAGADAFWLKRLAAAAGEPWSSRTWPLSLSKSGDLIAAAARKTGISRSRAVMMIQAAPEATHAAAEDAHRETWMWCDAMSPDVPRQVISEASSYRRRWPSTRVPA